MWTAVESLSSMLTIAEAGRARERGRPADYSISSRRAGENGSAFDGLLGFAAIEDLRAKLAASSGRCRHPNSTERILAATAETPDQEPAVNLERASLAATSVLVVAVVTLLARHALFANSPVGIGVQIGAGALMLWARLTFGGRSFHAAANPTAGGVVTTGPYRFVRHPI